MNIDEKDIIVLSDDNSYIVAKKIVYNDIPYYCVQNIKNDEDIKFLYENNGELIELEDEITFEKVLVEMADNDTISKLLDIFKKKLENK